MRFFGVEFKFNGFDIWHKGNFNPSTVATSGKYSDLSGTPTSSDILNTLKTVDGSGSGLDADTVGGLNATNFGRAYSSSYSFGGSQVAITTADFITLLSSLGAFSQPYWVSRGSWYYAANKYISDTGIGNIHLAGCTVEVIGNSSNYTIRIHTPTTSASGVINTEYIYVNNGSSYSPGWRKIWNDKNDGSGSGLDADLLDGQQGSYYAPIASPTFTGTPKSTTPATTDNSTNLATTAWVKALGYITAAGSGAKIAVSSTAPSSPQAGDFWYKTA